MFAQADPKPTFSLGFSNKITNSRKRFVADLNEHKLFNRSFDSFENQLRKNSQLKQTTLCLRKVGQKAKLDEKYEKTPKTEFLLLPVPKNKYIEEKKPKLNKTFCASTSALYNENFNNINDTMQLSKPSVVNTINTIMSKNGRDMRILVGKVDFCLKMHTQYPNVSALWNVYGKILKISKGKNKFEQIFLLRNDNIGPVLQSVYYDFNQTCANYIIGDYVHVFGRMISTNRLHSFRIEKITMSTWQQNFSRLYNVTAFVLSQNNDLQQHKAESN